MKIHQLCVISFLQLSPICAPACTNVQSVSIENNQLSPPPKSVRLRIHQTSTYKKIASVACVLVSREIQALAGQVDHVYFVTTANECAWGASLGPIWLASLSDDGQARVILETGGYGIRVLTATTDRKPDVIVYYQTAGNESRRRYHYDGTTYEPITFSGQ